ncbi:MAG: ACT domain-containing protein [Ilumatobacteraceae bacterium]
MTALVLTVIGDDRAGLVKAIATEVTAHGGNWERSQMAELAGKFAGIVLVSIPDDRVASFTASMTPLSGLLEVAVQQANPVDDDAGTIRWTLELLGADRPGIVSEVTTVLDHHGVNIDSLTTGTREAPMAAEMLFEAVAHLEIPPTTDVVALRVALEELANELMVDIDLAT